jgi:hypothetical protein
MTMTIDLTLDQEERLRREAAGRGLPTETLFQELVDQTLITIGQSVQPPKARVSGLHEGQIWIADDFDAPLPDSFWFGEE